MPFLVVRNDITKMQVDAIVNAANSSLLGGGGVDGAIHRAAGPKLLVACRRLGGCLPGQAKLTKGFDLPAKYVIHTVGPIWQDGRHGEAALLRSCYSSSLELAESKKCASVAFPLISAGSYGYPRQEAIEIATSAITEYLQTSEMTIYLVLYDRSSYAIGSELYGSIAAYIDQNYVDAHPSGRTTVFGSAPLYNQAPPAPALPAATAARKSNAFLPSPAAAPHPTSDAAPVYDAVQSAPSLESMLKTLDESFTQMLLRKIDEAGMTDAQCYKKANIDRKLFSKIRSDVGYKPSKPTTLAFILALELPPDEARDMLRKAGYALSNSNDFDIIVGYYIEHGNYNVFEINEALFAFDQPLLGA